MFHRNTHSSVVEYRISNPMTRVRFPLSVEKVRWLFSKASKAPYSKQILAKYGSLQRIHTANALLLEILLERGCPSG